MSIDLQDPPQPSVTSLLNGILGDLQRLVDQQLRLTRQEIAWELRQRAAGGAVIVLAAAVLLLSGAGLCLTLAHLMHWLASPAGSDPSWLPLWACHLVVAAVSAVIGVILLLTGKARFRHIAEARIPSTESLQEPAAWTTAPK